MNFNLYQSNYNNEYNLFETLSNELTNLYGIPVQYFKMHHHLNDNILGESIFSSSSNILNINIYPSNFDNWNGDDLLFNKFGLLNLDSLHIYIPKITLETIYPNLVHNQQLNNDNNNNTPLNDLIKFNSGRIMEVTHFKLTDQSLGNNNVFSSNRSKNLYLLTLKSYIADKTITLDPNKDLLNHNGDFSKLDNIFNPSDFEPASPRVKSSETNIFGDLG